MDLDILADILNDHEPLTRTLLSNLPRKELINPNVAAEDASLLVQTRGQPHNHNIRDPNIAGAVISKIEDVFESIAGAILDEKKEMAIQLKRRRRTGVHDIDGGAIRNPVDDETRTIRFPSKSPHEAWKFAALLRILELSHEALATGVVITKRDMYYRDPELFMKQVVVDRYVDDIAYTLGIRRDALNVAAAAKGLIAGPLSITRENGCVVEFRSEPEGILIPSTKDVQSIQLHDVHWILVIEKEATFRTLSTSRYWATSHAGRGIILTAKGYPDIQTRQFLNFLSRHALHVPIYCLVDFDPDGIGIMSTYKYGSMALAHENLNLAVPSIRWLGVRSGDIFQSEANKVGLLMLSKRDRRIAMLMLEKELFEEDGKEDEWRRELQIMLNLNVKAEIQILSAGELGMDGWLDEKLAGMI